MGSSLQEQLLKAGLVSEQKVRQARTDKRKQGRQPGGRTADPGQVAAQKARDEKAERDRDLNRKREEAARRKAVTAEVVEIIRSHRVPRDTGDTAYHFVDGKMVRRIYVTAEQRVSVSATSSSPPRPPRRSAPGTRASWSRRARRAHRKPRTRPTPSTGCPTISCGRRRRSLGLHTRPRRLNP